MEYAGFVITLGSTKKYNKCEQTKSKKDISCNNTQADDVTDGHLVNFENVNYEIDNNGDKWFSGKEICKILSYSDTKKAIHSHVNQEDKQKLHEIIKSNEITGGVRLPPRKYTQNELNSYFINKSAIFALLNKSNKKIAIEFQNFVNATVMKYCDKL